MFIISIIVSPVLKMYYVGSHIWTSFSGAACIFDNRNDALIVVNRLSDNDKKTDYCIEKVG